MCPAQEPPIGRGSRYESCRVKFHLAVIGPEWERAGLQTLARVPTVPAGRWTLRMSSSVLSFTKPQRMTTARYGRGRAGIEGSGILE